MLVNIATRPLHSQLNRLILARLPLTFPPHTSNPSTYVSGLLHIAPIYITFETLWDTFLNAPQLPTILNQALDSCEPAFEGVGSESVPIIPTTPGGTLEALHTAKVCSRTRSLLANLRLPGLLRAGRLRADIRVLTGTPEHKIGEQLDAVARNGRLAAFMAHTTRSVDANPHVLLAYAWVLYMALFSGGRYLRASLKEAGGTNDFWYRDSSPVRPYSITQEAKKPRRNSNCEADMKANPSRPRSRTRSDSHASRMVPGLSFFNFVGEEDGEDIKREFKKRIAEAEVLLTEGEKEDIVQEAQDIFRFMVEMVEELDRVMGTKAEDIESVVCRQRAIFAKQQDSVAIHKDRIDNKDSLSTALTAPRRSSYLEVLVANPVTAKIVQFTDNWDAILSPVRSSLSEKLIRRDSVDPNVRILDGIRITLVKAVITFLPIFALGAVFMAWHYMEQETRDLKTKLSSYLQ